jgi:hypothetical protein
MGETPRPRLCLVPTPTMPQRRPQRSPLMPPSPAAFLRRHQKRRVHIHILASRCKRARRSSNLVSSTLLPCELTHKIFLVFSSFLPLHVLGLWFISPEEPLSIYNLSNGFSPPYKINPYSFRKLSGVNDVDYLLCFEKSVFLGLSLGRLSGRRSMLRLQFFVSR